jgi:hypothetical protein
MIKGMHALFYTSEPDAMRAFLRDQLALPHIDVGDGWLIFDLPEADIGCHPIAPEGGPGSGTHAVSFYCDDIHKTMAQLTARGVVFNGEVIDAGWGLVTHFVMPGNVEVQLYQPKYPKRQSIVKRTAKKAVRKVKAAASRVKKKRPAAAKRTTRRRR